MKIFIHHKYNRKQYIHKYTHKYNNLQRNTTSVISRATYFQFPIQSAFLQYIAQQAEPLVWVWAAPALQHIIGQYRTTDVAENLCKSLSGAQRAAEGKDFELILTLKVESRHLVGKPVGREISAFVIVTRCI